MITEPSPIVITVDSIGPVNDNLDGFIHVTVTGGSPPYTYLWTDPAGANFNVEDIDNLAADGNYTIVVTDASNCTASMDSIFVDEDVAIHPTPKFKVLKVYPVPANDLLFVDMEGQIIEAFITGIDGRVVRHITNPASNTLQVEGLESGWYVIRIFDGKNWYIARMIK
jgi:hypothetical protein